MTLSFQNEKSLAKTFSSYMRRRRFKHVNSLITSIIERRGFCDILDIGGSKYYWDNNKEFLDRHKGLITITIANIDEQELPYNDTSMFTFIQGDARDANLYSPPYDLIHSNSLLEHIGAWGEIAEVADFIRKTDIPFYVQTPNYWFPIEPHFRFIGFQWLPISWRARLLTKRQLGLRKAKNFNEAMESVESVNLLDHFQISVLFPGARIVSEKFGPLTKSFMIISE